MLCLIRENYFDLTRIHDWKMLIGFSFHNNAWFALRKLPRVQYSCVYRVGHRKRIARNRYQGNNFSQKFKNMPRHVSTWEPSQNVRPSKRWWHLQIFLKGNVGQVIHYWKVVSIFYSLLLHLFKSVQLFGKYGTVKCY